MRLPNGLDLLVSIVDIGALCAFVLLHASVLSFFLIRRRSRHYATHLVLPLLGIATLVPVAVLANHHARLIGGIWLVIGLVVVAAQGGRAQGGSGGVAPPGS